MVVHCTAIASMASLTTCLHVDAIILSRVLGASVCLAVSLSLLVTVLVVFRKKALDTLPKRIFIVNVIFTTAGAAVALAGIDYFHRTLKNSDDVGPCKELAFTSHYIGGLIASFSAVWTLALLAQVALPVINSSYLVRGRLICHKNFTGRKRVRIAAEVILFLAVIISPALFISWEPFVISDLAPSGSNGVWCDYHRHVLQNCSGKVEVYDPDLLYLAALPFTIFAVICWVVVLLVVLVICGLWIKFKSLLVGKRIIESVPTLVLLMIAATITMLWLISSLSVIQFTKHRRVLESELTFPWIMYAILPSTANTIVELIVAVFLYFPFNKCCKRTSSTQSDPQQIPHIICINSDGDSSNPPSEWNHREIPSVTVYSPPDEMSDYRNTSERQVLLSQNRIRSYGASR